MKKTKPNRTTAMSNPSSASSHWQTYEQYRRSRHVTSPRTKSVLVPVSELKTLHQCITEQNDLVFWIISSLDEIRKTLPTGVFCPTEKVESLLDKLRAELSARTGELLARSQFGI